MTIEAYDVGLTTGKATLREFMGETDVEEMIILQDIDMTSSHRYEYLPRVGHTLGEYWADQIIIEEPGCAGSTRESRFLYGVVYGIAELSLLVNYGHSEPNTLFTQYPIERRPYLKIVKDLCKDLKTSPHMRDALAHLLKFLHGKEPEIYENIVTHRTVDIHVVSS